MYPSSGLPAGGTRTKHGGLFRRQAAWLGGSSSGIKPPVYVGVAEVSVYVAETARGKGFGRLLLQSLNEESEHKGIWTLQAGIFPENIPSIKVHLAVGFREIGLRSRIGKMGDIWRDVLLLERRSATIGCSARGRYRFWIRRTKLGLCRDPVDFFFHRVPVREASAFENRLAALDHFRVAAEIGSRVLRI